nr:hypothetical protein [Kibdelosporangium sp. MJ126-NF4]CEL23034.1 hypothetical protein [Kibdelosporangium sp. MJ126-NF4]CTQ90173.1 hypothetical protein [Kibdelosporangium sp. MJ126-NF4]
MTAILNEVGKRLLDRWATLLVLPGLLFVACVVVGVRLGHSHALDVRSLTTWITAHLTTGGSSAGGVAAVVLLIAAVALAATGAGLCAAVLGRVTTYLWTLPGRRVPMRWLVRRRQVRWERANARVAAAIDAAVSGNGQTGVGAALAARQRIALAEPRHPTWIGDRLAAPATRVNAKYRLDLAIAWPRLWLVVPDAVRTELTSAHAAYTAAARLVGWTVLYAILASLWWPSAIVAVVLAVTARVQSRAAASTLADLTESTVDIYGGELAGQLRITDETGELDPEVGFAITEKLRKDDLPAPTRPPSLADRAAERHG